jgi:lactoylglutathione lyase
VRVGNWHQTSIPTEDIVPSPTFHSGFYEVHLPVRDVERAIDFYGKLGFAVGFRQSETHALLLCSVNGLRSMLGLFRTSGDIPSHHVSFRVAESDVDSMIRYLLDREIQPLHPPRSSVQGPMHEPIVHGWMPAAAVFFRDPDGHLLELIADLSDPPRAEFLYGSLTEWRSLTLRDS